MTKGQWRRIDQGKFAHCADGGTQVELKVEYGATRIHANMLLTPGGQFSINARLPDDDWENPASKPILDVAESVTVVQNPHLDLQKMTGSVKPAAGSVTALPKRQTGQQEIEVHPAQPLDAPSVQRPPVKVQKSAHIVTRPRNHALPTARAGKPTGGAKTSEPTLKKGLAEILKTVHEWGKSAGELTKTSSRKVANGIKNLSAAVLHLIERLRKRHQTATKGAPAAQTGAREESNGQKMKQNVKRFWESVRKFATSKTATVASHAQKTTSQISDLAKTAFGKIQRRKDEPASASGSAANPPHDTEVATAAATALATPAKPTLKQVWKKVTGSLSNLFAKQKEEELTPSKSIPQDPVTLLPLENQVARIEKWLNTTELEASVGQATQQQPRKRRMSA